MDGSDADHRQINLVRDRATVRWVTANAQAYYSGYYYPSYTAYPGYTAYPSYTYPYPYYYNYVYPSYAGAYYHFPPDALQ